jgi:dihydroorotate dehydrogenase
VVNKRSLNADDNRADPTWEPLRLSNGKRELVLDPPWTNASGTLGFSTETSSLIDLSRLGGFVTNPVSLRKRDPANGPRFLPTPGGFVLHTGLPNPGLRECIRRHRRRWASLGCPLIVHLIADRPDELARMVEMLESIEEVSGVEVGVQVDDPRSVARLVGAAASGELPVLARLAFEAGVTTASAALEAGAAVISLAPPRGAIPAQSGMPVRGRLYGPAVFPMALEALTRLRGAGLEGPILAAGGIYRPRDLLAVFAAGASGAQLDSVLWTEPEAVLFGDRES